ncbi:MAG: 2-amino-4-hydroxy-6-hydroxymethyldihydropteridine diphosphokinase, partial [Acidobacteria bacterium]|nr:2-amino-4-hydroxy-6-hydroxymethyldihydropteridine diphosphokinase [Acidobacteriota bacterium]
MQKLGRLRYHAAVKKVAYLSLGSNQGDRRASLEVALEHLRKLGDVIAVSSFYETEPVGVTRQDWFLNCAVALETEQMPRQFLARVLAIEKAMGRRRAQNKGPRNIDIDIVLFGRHFADIYRFFERKVAGEPDELVQETFLACVRRRDQFRRQSSFRTF